MQLKPNDEEQCESNVPPREDLVSPNDSKTAVSLTMANEFRTQVSGPVMKTEYVENNGLHSKKSTMALSKTPVPEFYVCALCKEVYTSDQDLSNHLQTHLQVAHTNREIKTSDDVLKHVELSQTVVPDRIKQEPAEIKPIISNQDTQFTARDSKKKVPATRSAPGPKSCEFHQCRLCDNVFTKKSELSAHNQVCGRSFERNDLSENESLIHTSTKLHKGTFCSETSKSHENEQPDISDGKHQCTECNRNFTLRSFLNRHINYAHRTKKALGSGPDKSDQENFQCNICNKTLISKNNLKEHMRIHNPDLQFECPYCHKKCTHRTNLQRHIKAVHTNDRPFKCTKCNKAYVEKRALQRHLKSCSGSCVVEDDNNINRHNVTEETYATFFDKTNERKCAKCGEEFACVVKLKTHILRHLNAKPYQCDKCKKRFQRTDTLKQHLKTHTEQKHLKTLTKQKIFQCAKCDKAFSSVTQLKDHIFVHKAPQFKCTLCESVYKHKRNLTSHMKCAHS